MSNMSNDLKVAFIAAIVALLVSATGIAGSLAITNRQLDREERRSQSEFLRNSRKVAYSDVVAATLDLELKLRGVNNALEALSPGDSDLDQLHGAADAFESSQAQLGVSIANALIVGSAAMETELVSLGDLFPNIESSISQVTADVEGGDLAKARLDYSGQVADKQDDIADFLNSFLDSARLDLASPG